MKLYRIGACRHISDMTGTGGLYASGRWHSRGTRILYFSEHISLAKLEVLANSNFLPKKMCLLTIETKSDVSVNTIRKDELPEHWDSYPHPDLLKKLTANWITQSGSLLLKVPSAQSHNEYNYLLNPIHKEMDKVRVLSITETKFDHRLKLSND